MAWIAETGTGASAQAFTGSFIVAGSELTLKPASSASQRKALAAGVEKKDGATPKNEHD
jgi:hypothetical protein